jgi:hypothetical protein
MAHEETHVIQREMRVGALCSSIANSGNRKSNARIEFERVRKKTYQWNVLCQGKKPTRAMALTARRSLN